VRNERGFGRGCMSHPRQTGSNDEDEFIRERPTSLLIPVGRRRDKLWARQIDYLGVFGSVRRRIGGTAQDWGKPI